jgi:hypothetical protein
MPKIVLVIISVWFVSSASAAPLLWQADNGDILQVSQLPTGEYWASLTLSDDHTANFADNELILLQLDQQQPVSLVHGLRSCGAPARDPQQVAYQFTQNDDAWLLSARQAPPPLPEGFVIKTSDYPQLSSDRRAFVVDFPLQNAALPLWPQWQSAQSVTVHYSLDNGAPVAVQFDLSH